MLRYERPIHYGHPLRLVDRGLHRDLPWRGYFTSPYNQRENFMRLHRKYVFFVVILSALSAYTQLCGAPSGEAQGLTSSELSRLRSVGSVELSPDGRRIAYAVTMRDRPGRPYGQLWIMDVGAAGPIAHGHGVGDAPS